MHVQKLRSQIVYKQNSNIMFYCLRQKLPQTIYLKRIQT